MLAMQLGRPSPILECPLERIERPLPTPTDGELLLEVSACGVCRTGSGVTRWALGERAGVAWLASTSRRGTGRLRPRSRVVHGAAVLTAPGRAER
jgi:D-arabinose 1-dehydrogenase-like Zn-dependent alcohol dehydrogenase